MKKLLFLSLFFTCSLFADNFIKTEIAFNEIPSIKTPALNYLQESSKHQEVTRFIFVRHGESNSNKEKSMAGRTLNTELSENGVAQAKEIGQLLQNVKIDLAFSSPTSRAKATAEYILSEMNLNCLLHFDERLHERWYGPFEGASESKYAGIKKKEETDIAALQTFFEKFHYRPHPEMESMQEIYFRACQFILQIGEQYQGKNILVATHNGVMKALFMADAFHNGFNVEYFTFDLGNCSVLIVEVDSYEKLDVPLINVQASKGLKFRKKG